MYVFGACVCLVYVRVFGACVCLVYVHVFGACVRVFGVCVCVCMCGYVDVRDTKLKTRRGYEGELTL